MKIYLSIPNEGWIRSELAMKLPRWLKETSHEVYFESSNEKPIEHNRNSIVQRFLASDKDYLLQIDSDVVPNANPLYLVDLRLDIVSAPCWIYQHKNFLNVYRFDKNKEFLMPLDLKSNKHIVEVDATGSGVLLVSRKVLETIKAPFARKYDENGIAILGQDLYFCEKAREAGFKIYAHFDYISKHYKTIDLGEFSR
jgi:GT2 family glycosyltransferase